MRFPYPINDALFSQIISEEGHQDYPIDEPAAFWALFFSCVDCSKADGGRLTEAVQQRLRQLIDSQLFRNDVGEIIGSKSTIPLQYSGNSFCFVGASTDDELALLRDHGAVMPRDDKRGQQPFTLHPKDVPIKMLARNIFVLLQRRTAVANNVDLGYCLAGGLSNLISPDALDQMPKEELPTIAAKYDNVYFNPYLNHVSMLDPSADDYAIKRAAATRQLFDKGGRTLKANFEGEELAAAEAVLEEMAANCNRQTFKAQAAATAIPDPLRILRDACPSATTLLKTEAYLDPQVHAHWVASSKKAPPYFINDFVSPNDDDDPYLPSRLRFPVSASLIGHLSAEKAAMLPLNAKDGVVGRDKYKFVCVSLLALLRPGLLMYTHEMMISLLSGIAFRFKTSADFIGFIKECATSLIEDIEMGRFREVLSGSNFGKVFKPEATDDEMLAQLKQLAYFNFPRFQADYLCKDKFLESAYMLNKQLPILKQELDKIWDVSRGTILAAVRKYRAANMEAQAMDVNPKI